MFKIIFELKKSKKPLYPNLNQKKNKSLTKQNVKIKLESPALL